MLKSHDRFQFSRVTETKKYKSLGIFPTVSLAAQKKRKKTKILLLLLFFILFIETMGPLCVCRLGWIVLIVSNFDHHCGEARARASNRRKLVTNCSSGDSISTGWWVLFAAENKTNICVPQQQQLSINFIVATAQRAERVALWFCRRCVGGTTKGTRRHCLWSSRRLKGRRKAFFCSCRLAQSAYKKETFLTLPPPPKLPGEIAQQQRRHSHSVFSLSNASPEDDSSSSPPCVYIYMLPKKGVVVVVVVERDFWCVGRS